MRLIGLVESADHVCCRYRLKAFRPLWERAGHSLELRALPKRAWQWFRMARDLRRADAVILQRKLPAPWQLFLLRRSAKQLLFDFDDAVFLRDSYAAKGFHSVQRHRRFAAVVGSADIVVAGNDYLAQAARRHAESRRVLTIPTCVDPDLYSHADHVRSDSAVRLVWVGSSSTLRGLERARVLLEKIGERCPGVTLHMVSDRFTTFQSLPVVTSPWSEQNERRELCAADIGVSWIPDDPWSRGKCGLKVLQYMAAGLPVVANSVGVHPEMVRNNETGFLADTADQWVAAIQRLARNPDLRRTFGRAGWKMLETRYSIRAGAERWQAVFDTIVKRRQSA